ncbi:MAG: HupE/UreJ family protein [Merismopedia sp. SIO2A8]|nr:HupE/UreJ family protein [Merismopedia sp. SIO2A8]
MFVWTVNDIAPSVGTPIADQTSTDGDAISLAVGGNFSDDDTLTLSIGHPIIGIDHFVFVVAIGLLLAIKPRAILIPVAFVLATLAGTGIHLLSLDLPAAELFISASVLISGIILAMKDSPNSIAIATLAAIAGLFHGYAYGEAIVGAEMTPLVAYLLGFALIQLAIALVACQVGRFAIKKVTNEPALLLRFAGFTICGAGAAFLSSVIVG